MPNSIGNWLTTAKALKPARAEQWREVFGTDEVPITCPIPLSIGSFPGVGEKAYYLLDLKAITPEQKERLIASIALEFNLPIEEVRGSIDQVGCPILADDVTTSSTDSGLFHSIIDDGRLDGEWSLDDEEDHDGYFDDDEEW